MCNYDAGQLITQALNMVSIGAHFYVNLQMCLNNLIMWCQWPSHTIQIVFKKHKLFISVAWCNTNSFFHGSEHG